MHIILGGTGHVGSATAAALLARGEPVTIVTRGGSRAEAWRRRGAQVATADVRDVSALRRIFQQGTRLFLLNPPADPSTDTDSEERETGAAIIAAVKGSGLQKLVLQSTYGAQPGERCGDLSTLYELERAARAQPVPVSVLRAAYYMSNWDHSLELVRKTGQLHTPFPAGFSLPMVAASDIGLVASRLLTEPPESTGLHYVEGPERYSPSDVAAAFAAALGKPVEPVSTPRAEWRQTFESLGWSARAAESYANMTAATVDALELPDAPERGNVSIRKYVAQLVERSCGSET